MVNLTGSNQQTESQRNGSGDPRTSWARRSNLVLCLSLFLFSGNKSLFVGDLLILGPQSPVCLVFLSTYTDRGEEKTGHVVNPKCTHMFQERSRCDSRKNNNVFYFR